MPYKKSFVDLLKQFEQTSEEIVREANISTKSLVGIFDGISCDQVINRLIAVSIGNSELDYNSIIWQLSRPHIGLGNPNSKTLIIGKELGFEETKQLFGR